MFFAKYSCVSLSFGGGTLSLSQPLFWCKWGWTNCQCNPHFPFTPPLPRARWTWGQDEPDLLGLSSWTWDMLGDNGAVWNKLCDLERVTTSLGLYWKGGGWRKQWLQSCPQHSLWFYLQFYILKRLTDLRAFTALTFILGWGKWHANISLLTVPTPFFPMLPKAWLNLVQWARLRGSRPCRKSAPSGWANSQLFPRFCVDRHGNASTGPWSAGSLRFWVTERLRYFPFSKISIPSNCTDTHWCYLEGAINNKIILLDGSVVPQLPNHKVFADSPKFILFVALLKHTQNPAEWLLVCLAIAAKS